MDYGQLFGYLPVLALGIAVAAVLGVIYNAPIRYDEPQGTLLTRELLEQQRDAALDDAPASRPAQTLKSLLDTPSSLEAQEAQIQSAMEALEGTLEDIDRRLKAHGIEPPSRETGQTTVAPSERAVLTRARLQAIRAQLEARQQDRGDAQ